MANLRLTWSQDEYRSLFGSVDYRESRKEAERGEREGNQRNSILSSLLEGVDTRLIPAFVNAFLIDALGTFSLAAKRSRSQPKLWRIRRLALIFDYIRPV